MATSIATLKAKIAQLEDENDALQDRVEQLETAHVGALNSLGFELVERADDTDEENWDEEDEDEDEDDEEDEEE